MSTTLTLSHPTKANFPAAGNGRMQIMLIFFFGTLAVLLKVSERLLQDPDTQWHITVGEQIWRAGTFPYVDEFSHTFAGAPWIAKEWLSQLILYGAYALGGWLGVALLTVLTISIFFTFFLAWLADRVKVTIAIQITLVVFLMAAGQFVARPHIFSFPLLMLWLGGLLGALEQKRAPSWWLIPLLVLWANMHASFTIAFVIAAVLGMEALVTAPAAERIRTAAGWGIFGLAALASTGITPYGYEPFLVTFKLFGSNEAVQYITEWQPLRANFAGALAVSALVMCLVLLGLSWRRNLFRILLILVIGFLMVRHVRFLGLFAITAAMVLAVPLAQRFPARKLPAARLTPRMQAVSFGILAALTITSATLIMVTRPRPGPQVMPSAALEAARKAGATGPVFNDYDFGGYLISQGIKTFIDGRSDQLFIGGFMHSLFKAEKSETEAPLKEILDKHDISWALTLTNARFAQKIEKMDRWEKVHQDDIATVFLRR